ncbi:hypothetical protein ACS0TY_023030 [Phlomoides rotata]
MIQIQRSVSNGKLEILCVLIKITGVWDSRTYIIYSILHCLGSTFRDHNFLMRPWVIIQVTLGRRFIQLETLSKRKEMESG